MREATATQTDANGGHSSTGAAARRLSIKTARVLLQLKTKESTALSNVT